MSREEFWELVEELGGGPAVFVGAIIVFGVIGIIFYIAAKTILF